MTQGESDAPDLEVDAEIHEGSLHVSLRVVNTLKETIYLFNRLWEWTQTGEYVSADYPAYVCMSEGRILHLLIGVPPLPAGLRTEVRIIPFATVVAPGEEYTETLDLRLPVVEYNPYFPGAPDSAYVSTEAKGLIVALHYVRKLEGLETKASPLQGAVWLHHPSLLARVEILQTATIALPVPLNKRPDIVECS